MTVRGAIILAVRTLTAPTPRIKGYGMLLGLVARRFRRWDETIETNVFGSRMRVNSADYLGNIVIFTPNYFDREERAFIARLVRPGDYVVDVGANIGIYTLLLARLVTSTGRVTAIEAERRNAAALRENLALNAMRWVDVREYGATDKVETLRLSLNVQGNAGAHSFAATRCDSAGSHQEIMCLPLAQQLDPDRTPRFMKVDIEGYEYRVLCRYFEDVPRARWPEYLMVEDSPAIREGDAVALCTGVGYVIVARHEFNVLLARS